jgi:hypothetical protein
MGKNMELTDSGIDILFYAFESNPVSEFNSLRLMKEDETIAENRSFIYPVFVPKAINKMSQSILLMHGLNERNWNKYLTWAEYLCQKTGKAIILFPIAFHINRSPASWSNPRVMQTVMDLRRKQNKENRSLSFANVALSERISENPLRFFTAGKQSFNDVMQLAHEIKRGKHPLFRTNTQLDIFSYSIGAFLSEIVLMVNQDGLWDESKFFAFCGGGIFSSMYGESRSIMDKQAFSTLHRFYLNEFDQNDFNSPVHDALYKSFNAMISPEKDPWLRNQFFSETKNRMQCLMLQKDKVMPYEGVSQAMGADLAAQNVSVMDFSFEYSHENPFPVNGLSDNTVIDEAFEKVFIHAANFLS